MGSAGRLGGGGGRVRKEGWGLQGERAVERAGHGSSAENRTHRQEGGGGRGEIQAEGELDSSTGGKRDGDRTRWCWRARGGQSDMGEDESL